MLASSYSQTPFTSLIQVQAAPGQEIRIDDIASGDLYHGRAPDRASTSAPVWEIVHFYRDADATILRIRYVSAAIWDDRTSGTLWP